MKKVLLLIVMVFMPLFVFAKEYEIDNIGVKLSINDDWYVFTRDNYINNANLAKFNIDENYMKNFFYNNKAYLDAVPSNLSYDFIISITTENLEMTNLSNYPSSMIEKYTKDVVNGLQDAKYSIDDSGKIKYMIISFYDNNNKLYLYRYYTVFDNKGYSFHIQKSTELTDEEKRGLDEIMKTVEFDTKNFNSKETPKMQKEIDNYGKSKKWYENILIDALIGGLLGGLGSIVVKVLKKKKNVSE